MGRSTVAANPSLRLLRNIPVGRDSHRTEATKSLQTRLKPNLRNQKVADMELEEEVFAYLWLSMMLLVGCYIFITRFIPFLIDKWRQKMSYRYWKADRFLADARHAGYNYRAETPSTMRPSKKYGDFVSAVPRCGTRVWVFKTVVQRDKFVEQTGARRVFSDHETQEMNAKNGLRNLAASFF